MLKFLTRRVFIILLALSFFTNSYAQRVGLVLSGGGARGIAHIGLIQALEDNNIPIDYITGTSMGAIVASLYSMGYTPQEMVDLILSDEFKLWQSGKFDDNMVNSFLQSEPTPSFFSVKIPLKDSLNLKPKPKFLPESLIKPQPMNFAFIKLFSHATARINGDFDNLFVPIRTVSSDIYNKKAVISGSGDLGDAVRASMSFPFVFKPIELNGNLVYDGGMYDNFPVQVMKDEFAPDFILGSVVSKNPEKPQEGDLMGQIDNMVMQKTNYEIDSIDGLAIKYDLDNVSLLEMNRANEIFDIGYKGAQEYIDYIKSRVPREVTKEQVNINREVYKSTDPVIEFEDIKLSGINKAQETYVEKRFQKQKDEAITMEEAEKAYFGLLSDSKVEDIKAWVSQDDSTGHVLNMELKLNNNLEVSLGGLITSTNANRIYLGVDYRFINVQAFDVGLGAQIGRAYNTIDFRSEVVVARKNPKSLGIRVAYWNQKFYESDRLFSSSETPCFIKEDEVYVRLNLGSGIGNSGKIVYTGGVAYIKDEYYQSNQIDFSSYNADRSEYLLWNAGAELDINRILVQDFPINGYRHLLRVGVFGGQDKYIPSQNRDNDAPQQVHKQSTKIWFQANYKFDKYFKLNESLRLGMAVDGFFSSKPKFSNYTATIIQASAFNPTLHSQTVFNEYYRANNYLAVGVKPIYKINDLFHLRAEGYAFQPLIPIKPGINNVANYGRFKFDPRYIAELTAVCSLPFTTISAFVNYYSSPKASFNVGLNIGFLLNTPKFSQ